MLEESHVVEAKCFSVLLKTCSSSAKVTDTLCIDFLISALPACCASNNAVLSASNTPRSSLMGRRQEQGQNFCDASQRWCLKFAGIAIRAHQGRESLPSPRRMGPAIATRKRSNPNRDNTGHPPSRSPSQQNRHATYTIGHYWRLGQLVTRHS